MQGELLKRSSPLHPLQELCTKVLKGNFKQTDERATIGRPFRFLNNSLNGQGLGGA